MSSLEQNKVTKNTSDLWIDEIQSIASIEELYNSFIKPIDQVRSIAKSTASIENTSTDSSESYGKVIDSENFNESRANAFFRVIGFPVASTSEFYNQGHNPDQYLTRIKRKNVEENLAKNPDLLNLIKSKETEYFERLKVFSEQSDMNETYSFFMLDPKPFLMADPASGPFDNDQQSKPIDSRDNKLKQLNFRISNLAPKFLVNVSHKLKPFIVNPDILKVCDDQKRVCVPFIEDRQGTLLEGNFYLKRPVIEYIIRQRLKVSDKKSNEERLKSVLSTAGVSSFEELNKPDSVFSSELSIFNKNQSYEQISNIISYTKSIRYCVKQLNESITDAYKFGENLDVHVVCSTKGPEFGGLIKLNSRSTLLSEVSEDPSKKSQAEIQKALLELKKVIEQIKAETDTEQSKKIGDSTVFFGPTSVDIFANKKSQEHVEDINESSRQRGARVIDSIRRIEIITGEISGIGLVDILAVYMALWSIDLKFLIGFLDDASLVRMTLDQNLKEVPEVQDQINGNRPSIQEVLSEFERVFFNILAYADKYYEQVKQNPTSPRRGKSGVPQ